MASIEARDSGKSGPRWRVVWRRNGKKVVLTLDDPKVAERAKKLCEGLRHDVDRDTLFRRVYGLPDEPESKPASTLCEFVEKTWWPNKRDVQIDTASRYRRQWELHIRDVIVDGRPMGEHAMAEITKSIVKSWVSILIQNGMKARTLHSYHGVLHQILSAAVDDGLLASNPATRTGLPRIDKDMDEEEEHVYLTHEEARIFRKAFRSELAADITAVLLGTGIRWSELTALQHRDIVLDDTRPRIHIRRAWKNSREAGRGWYLGPPKSKKSRRIVSLSKEMEKVLKEYYSDDDPKKLVFANRAGKMINHSNFHREHWKPAVLRAQGLDPKTGEPLDNVVRTNLLTKTPTPHDMRHTHASWLIADRQPLPAIQRRLGHDSITTTVDVYGHLLPDVDDDLLAGLDRALLM